MTLNENREYHIPIPKRVREGITNPNFILPYFIRPATNQRIPVITPKRGQTSLIVKGNTNSVKRENILQQKNKSPIKRWKNFLEILREKITSESPITACKTIKVILRTLTGFDIGFKIVMIAQVITKRIPKVISTCIDL